MKNFTFVIMPFSKQFDDIYKLGIKEVANEHSVKAERLDEQIFEEGMLDRIFRQIEISDFVIADLSDRNANVFYELGYAHAKEKICILLTKDAEDIPFDLKHKRHIVYGDSISYLKKELSKNIDWALKEVEKRRKSKIEVIVKRPNGSLETDKHQAKATLNFQIDLHNKENKAAPEITAVYMYTGLKWDLTVSRTDCPYLSSDLDDQKFKYRYLLTKQPIKIGKKGWSQLKVKAERVLAQAYKGDEIKDKYSIGGRGVLRIETSEENYDHEFYFNVDIEEIPF